MALVTSPTAVFRMYNAKGCHKIYDYFCQSACTGLLYDTSDQAKSNTIYMPEAIFHCSTYNTVGTTVQDHCSVKFIALCDASLWHHVGALSEDLSSPLGSLCGRLGRRDLAQHCIPQHLQGERMLLATNE